MGARFVNHEYDYRQNWTTESPEFEKQNNHQLNIFMNKNIMVDFLHEKMNPSLHNSMRK